MKDFELNPIENISAGPGDDNDYFKWTLVIVGPKDTPWNGGIFFGKITFPMDYPWSPPKLRIDTKIYHSGVTLRGGICCCNIQI